MIPFIIFANQYLAVGSSFSPAILRGLSREKIASDLAHPTSPVTRDMIASANEQTAVICTLTKGKPRNVCNSVGVLAAKKAMKI